MTQAAVAAEATRARRRRRKRWAPRRLGARTLLHVVVLALAAVFVAPIVWGFFSSLRDVHAGVSGAVIPNPAHWDNYRYAWSGEFAFSHYLWNTVVLTFLGTAPAVLTSALAGYAFARMRARGRNVFFVFASFPAELDDAAAIDGAGHLRTFLQIYLPNSIGPLAVAVVILGTGWWGEYILASLLLPDQLIPLGVKVATGYYDPAQQFALVPVQLAGSLLFTIPPLLAFFALQKRLARGIVTTGLKG